VRTIPTNIVRDFLPKAGDVSMFGVPLEHLSREELIACLVMQVLENRDSIVERRRQLKVLAGLRK